jgi:hypothetical protein
MSLKPFTKKRIAMDRAVYRQVADSSGGVSYSDIADCSQTARDLLDDHDEENKGEGGHDPEGTNAEKADAKDWKHRGRDTGASIQTSRRKATLTGVR